MPLVLNGTTGVQDNSGAFVAGTAVASTSGTSIDFTSIPSWVKRVTVNFSNVSTNGSSIPQVQLGSGSVTTSGYSATATGFQANALLVSSFYTTGFPLGCDGGAGYVLFGSIVFTNVTSNTWVGSMAAGATSSGTPRTMHGGGTIALSGTLDRVRFTTTNGTDTFDAGNINILYE